jgi:hypothetical protein
VVEGHVQEVLVLVVHQLVVMVQVVRVQQEMEQPRQAVEEVVGGIVVLPEVQEVLGL